MFVFMFGFIAVLERRAAGLWASFQAKLVQNIG